MKHPLWVLTQQEEDKEGADCYAREYYLNPKNDWTLSICRAVEYRCFFGALTANEIHEEDCNMERTGLKGDYIVCLGRFPRENFTFLELINQSTVTTTLRVGVTLF